MTQPGGASTAPVEATGYVLWPEVSRLLGASDASDLGYMATLQEILQQPGTWRDTGIQMCANLPMLAALLDDVESVLLTGSGSSEYVGDCVRAVLQRRLGRTVQAVGSGALLTDGISMFPVARPALMVSFARSGDSPESVGALSLVLAAEPTIRHLALTCNADGRLSKAYEGDRRVSTVVLHEKTNDRSLVMTSSFTNMVVAALALGWTEEPEEYLELSDLLSEGASRILQQCFALLPAVSRRAFSRVVYLASISQLGAAKESALKMTEMTAGRVMSTCETYLGLRHGPMSMIHEQTLIVCFLSADSLARAYELDLIEELNAKKLGMHKILVGSELPRELMQPGDIGLEDEAFSTRGADSLALLHVLVSQVLAFYRCLEEGLKPDAPSQSGVIHRVVQGFTLRGAAAQDAQQV